MMMVETLGYFTSTSGAHHDHVFIPDPKPSVIFATTEEADSNVFYIGLGTIDNTTLGQNNSETAASNIEADQYPDVVNGALDDSRICSLPSDAVPPADRDDTKNFPPFPALRRAYEIDYVDGIRRKLTELQKMSSSQTAVSSLPAALLRFNNPASDNSAHSSIDVPVHLASYISLSDTSHNPHFPDIRDGRALTDTAVRSPGRSANEESIHSLLLQNLGFTINQHPFHLYNTDILPNTSPLCMAVRFAGANIAAQTAELHKNLQLTDVMYKLSIFRQRRHFALRATVIDPTAE